VQAVLVSTDSWFRTAGAATKKTRGAKKLKPTVGVEDELRMSEKSWSAGIRVKGYLSLYHNCDSTTIRLRYDYDEKLTCSFRSSRMEAGARDAS